MVKQAEVTGCWRECWAIEDTKSKGGQSLDAQGTSGAVTFCLTGKRRLESTVAGPGRASNAVQMRADSKNKITGDEDFIPIYPQCICKVK